MSNSSSAQTTPAQNPPKRSGVRTFFGWLLIVIAVLALLGNLARLSSITDASGGTAQMLGALVGVVAAVAVPLVIGLLLLRRPQA